MCIFLPGYIHIVAITHGEEVGLLPAGGELDVEAGGDHVDGRLHAGVGVVMEQHQVLHRLLVTDHVTTETPLVPRDLCQQLPVGTGWHAVDPS